MFKLNSFCKECFEPYKIVWNCKKHIDDKEWVYLCYNCIRYLNILMAENLNPNFKMLNL